MPKLCKTGLSKRDPVKQGSLAILTREVGGCIDLLVHHRQYWKQKDPSRGCEMKNFADIGSRKETSQQPSQEVSRRGEMSQESFLSRDEKPT